MTRWFRNCFIVFFVFLFANIQAKNNSCFLSADTVKIGVAGYRSIFNGIEEGSIKTFGNFLGREKDTMKKADVINRILLAPDATLVGTGSGTTYGGIPVFRNCSNPASAVFSFRNGSTTTATNASYRIAWGDGSPDFVASAPWNTIQDHTYLRGTYTLVFTVVDNVGESTSKNYTVFVGTNPEVSISNPGGNSICTNNQLSFRILGIANNSPSTVYKVTINDATPPSVQYYNQPAQGVDFIDVTHTFVNTSCGTNSQVGNSTYTDAFYASVEASNPCNVATGLIAPLYVSTPPIPNFTTSTAVVPPSTVPASCTNATVRFTNSSTGGSLASALGCNSNSKLVWSVSPATYAINGGTLGNDYGTSDTDLWDSGSNSLDLKFLSPGTYTIKMKIGNACGTNQISKTICIENPLVPAFTLSSNSICNTTPANGIVTATNTTNISNSCNTPTYLWDVTYVSSNCGSAPPTWSSGSLNSKDTSFRFTTPGTYTVKLSVTNSCGTVSSSQTVEVKQPPVVTINGPVSRCGGYDATSPALPTAIVQNCRPDSSTLTYSWSFPGGSPATSTSLNPGPIVYPLSTTVPVEYSIDLTVTNECGSTTATTYKFTISPVPHVVNTVLEQTICSGSASTPVVLTSDYVRTPPDMYSWTATATSGVSGFISSGTGNLPSQTISTSAANSGSVTYAITPSSFGCSGPVTNYIIKVDPLPYFTTQPADNGLCEMGNTNPLTVVANVTPSSYQWFSNIEDNTTTGTPIVGANSASYTPPNTLGINYYYCTVTFTVGACRSITSRAAKVEVVIAPSIVIQPTSNQYICVGGQIPTPLTIVTRDGVGVKTYQWYLSTNNATSFSPIIGAVNDTYLPPSAVLGAAWYYVEVTFSGSNCGVLTSTTSQIISVTDPTITTQPLPTQTLCEGTPPANLTVSAIGGLDNSGGIGGAYSFNYQWYSSPNNTPNAGVQIPGANSNTYTPPTTSTGTTYYFCYVSQSNGLGCDVYSNKAEVIVHPQARITLEPKDEDICVGGIFATLGVNYSGAFMPVAYQWYSNTSASNDGGALIVGATESTYTPTIVTNTPASYFYYCEIYFPHTGGCSSIKSRPVTLKVIGQTTITTQPARTQTICSGGGVTLSVVAENGAGMATYQWYSTPRNSNVDGVAIPNTNTASYTPPPFATAGTYYYYVTIQYSGNGCTLVTSSVSEVIVVPDPILQQQPIVSQVICKDALPLTVIATGGYVAGTYLYQWYSSPTTTNNNGTPLTGNGANTDTYNPTNESPAEYGSITKYFYCNITQSGAGCGVTSNTSEVVTFPFPKIDVQPLSQSICLGDAVSVLKVTSHDGVRVNGSPTYQWYFNTTNSYTGTPILNETNSNYTPPVNAVGVNYYYCIISFLGGCGDLISDIATIRVNPIPSVSLVSQVNVKCYGDATGEIVVNATGGTPIPGISYNYAWTGPNGFVSANQNLTGLYAGTYNLIVTDQSSCQITLQVTITQNPEIIITPTIISANCTGSNNGSIKIVVSGGVAPYQITWSDFGTGDIRDNLAPGDYVVTVTDAENCNKTQTINIPAPPPFYISPVVTNISCFGSKDGSIVLNITGGIPPIKVVWDDNPVAGNTRNNLVAGTYSVTVSDDKPCFIRDSFVIVEPQPLALTANLTNAFDCDNANSGAINLLVSGGTAPFTYNWSNGSTTEDLVNVPAGNYLVTVTDARGCKKQAEYVIYRQSPIVIVVDTQTDFNCDMHSVKQTFVANVSGGFPPYQLSWSSGIVSGSNNEIMNTNQNGTVTLTVVDGLGCTALNAFEVKIPELGYPGFETSSYAFTSYGFYSVVDPIQFTNTSSGDFVGVAWDFGDGSVSTEINSTHTYLTPGEYTVLQTVTYPFGCFYIQSKVLNVEKGYELISPNAFTPNGDGINDFFMPQFLGMKSVKLEVYNTWGELIFSEKGETIRGWDGYVKNKLSENGNYFYKISATTFYGAEIKNDGAFTLIN